MLYTIENKFLTVTINDLGAEVFSIKKDGREYLYNGNPKYWDGRSPIMFPICGRLYGGAYTYNGNRYEMPIHGIVKTAQFSVSDKKNDQITFALNSNENTLEEYPFNFEFKVTYKLADNALITDFEVVNTDTKALPFSLGAHPGFTVPVGGVGDFEDCFVEFSTPCPAKRVNFSPTCFLAGEDKLFGGEDFKTLPLNHSLFDNDAIFLYDTAKSVTLKSNKTDFSVKVDFDGFKYLGFWHAPKSDAPYVCIEPWTGIPSTDGIVDDFSTKKDFTFLDGGKTYTLSYKITIE